MGNSNILNVPVLEKVYENTSESGFEQSALSVHGMRLGQEDRILCSSIKSKNCQFHAVFDGHGGSQCSEECKRILCQELELQSKTDEQLEFMSDDHLTKTFVSIDTKLRETLDRGKTEPGSCCISMFITPVKDDKIQITAANIGDSRCIVYHSGEIICMSQDHKLSEWTETKRVEDNGGYVENARICGMLNVSRAFGDFQYKLFGEDQEKNWVMCIPEITRKTIDLKDRKRSFSVVACDGIWDKMNNEEVVTFINYRLDEMDNGVYYHYRAERMAKLKTKLLKMIQDDEDWEDEVNTHPELENFDLLVTGKGRPKYDLDCICEEIVYHCILELNSIDNVSIVITLFTEKK